MALANSTLITVTATYTRLDGRAASGQVFFSSNQVLVNSTSGEIVPPVDFVATLDANGAISIDLPATDDPDYEPQGWTYTVTEDTDGGDRPPFGLSVPADGGAIDLADVAPPGPTESLTADEYTLLSTFTSHRSAWGGDPPAGSADDLLGLDANNIPKIVPGDTYTVRRVEDVQANHGAVLDDATDDTAAIQAAIDSLNGERGFVLIPGHAYCASSLDPKRAILVGLGIPGVSGGGGTQLRFGTTAGLSSSIEDGKGYQVRDMRVKGSGVKATNGQVLIDFTGQGNPVLRDVDTAESDIGVKLNAGTTIECNYGTFIGSAALQCTQGWLVANGRSHTWYGGRDWDCTTGVYIDVGNNLAFHGHFMEAHDVYAVNSAGTDVSFYGCRWENPNSTSNLNIRSGAGRHYDFGSIWGSAPEVTDANSPSVLYGIAAIGDTNRVPTDPTDAAGIVTKGYGDANYISASPELVIPHGSTIETPATSAWFSADAGLGMVFNLPAAKSYRYARFRVGTSSGNIQVSVAELDQIDSPTATRVMDSGVIACPTAGDVRLDLGATSLSAGLYMLWLWCDNITAAFVHGDGGVESTVLRYALTASGLTSGLPSSQTMATTGRWVALTLEAG